MITRILHAERQPSAQAPPLDVIRVRARTDLHPEEPPTVVSAVHFEEVFGLKILLQLSQTNLLPKLLHFQTDRSVVVTLLGIHLKFPQHFLPLRISPQSL